MSDRVLLGMLTPSSNTRLEPICAGILHGLSDVSAHFARFPVTEISLKGAALAQFDDRPMLEAAALLADARVHAICWNGTSAGWLGLDADRKLCASIAGSTGIPATSSMLAVDEIFRRTGVRRFGLVSPYLRDVQDRMVAMYRDEGFACAAERHLGLSENFAFSEIAPDTLRDMVRAVAAERPDAIAIVCTNLQSAPLVDELEREIGIPIYDTTATAVWSAMRLAGADPARVKGWGRLFGEME